MNQIIIITLTKHCVYMNVCVRVFRDRKKKRFVRDNGKEDKKNKIKTESGQVVSVKRTKKNLYPFICRLKHLIKYKPNVHK